MFKKIFTNSSGILFSRILGFVRDLLTAGVLGASIYSDIFFVAFKLPNLFRRIFAEGAFVQSFLPSYTKTRHKNLFAAAVFTKFFLIIVALSLLVTLFAPFFTKLIAIGFDERLIELAAPYTAINFYYLDFIFAVTFLAALLQYKEHFATTAYATALLNIALIAALLMFKDAAKEEVVLAMSMAVLIGGTLQLLFHIAAAKRLGIWRKLIQGFVALPKYAHKIRQDLAHFYRSFFPAIWGNSTAQISAFLDTWLASFLAAGSISYLYYANRILQLPLALFAIATATALFPSVSKALHSGEEERAFVHLKKSFWLLLALLLLSAVGGVLLSRQIIWLLFEHGSFTRHDTIQASGVLAMYMIGLVPYGLAKLFSLWLYATHRQKEAARIASYSLAANVAASLALIAPMQAAGLALGSSIAGFVLLYYTLKSFGLARLRKLFDKKALIFLVFALALEVAIIVFIKSLWRIDAHL